MYRGEYFDFVVGGGTDGKWPVRRSPKGLYCVYDIVACLLEKEIDRAHAFKRACADNFPALADMELGRDFFGGSRVPAATPEQASQIVDFVRAAMTIPGVRRMRSVHELELPDPPAARPAADARQRLARVFGPSGRVISHVREDGFFSAFDMLGQVSKAWTLFVRDDVATQTQLRASLEAKGLSWRDAIRRPEDGTVWVHPDVAVVLAGWCDPEFVPRIRRFVDVDFEDALAASEQDAAVWGAIKRGDVPANVGKSDLERAKERHAALQAESAAAAKACADRWKAARDAEAIAIAADKVAHALYQDALQAQFDLMCAEQLNRST